MVDFEYLRRGVSGLAHAHRANAMTGHLGAAVVAGYFIGENHPDLDPGVHRSVERELTRITDGEESFWFDSKKAGITIRELFAPLPEGPSGEPSIDEIARALEGNMGRLRQSGHNVIFASLAIRALHDHPDLAGAAAVTGIRKLISGFDQAPGGRGYYGKPKGSLRGDAAPLSDEAGTPPYKSTKDMVEVVIGELIESAGRHRQGFGGLFHLINHAAALTELEHFGFPELARKGLAAHRQHLRHLRALPDLEEELGKLEKAKRDPFNPDYWARTDSDQWSAWLTHRIKTIYGFNTLLRFIDDDSVRQKAREQFLYLMA